VAEGSNLAARPAEQIDTRSTVLDFYGLREQPFGVTPNPRFFYPTVAHREALAALICGVDNHVGFAALISAPGTGKTTLLFDLMNQRSESADTAFIFNTQCSGNELVRQIVDELGIDSPQQDPIRMHADLRVSLANQARTRPVLIIIDEAHNLEDSALETVRLLSDFETPDHKLLHIVLAGQPELAEKLSRPGLLQLRQRITMVSRLHALRPDELAPYVQHRLRVAGHSGGLIFSRDALRNIAVLTRGIPREVNRLCFNALLLGCASGRHLIEPDIINEVVRDLDLTNGIQGTQSAVLPNNVSEIGGQQQPHRASAQPARPAASHEPSKLSAAQFPARQPAMRQPVPAPRPRPQQSTQHLRTPSVATRTSKPQPFQRKSETRSNDALSHARILSATRTEHDSTRSNRIFAATAVVLFALGAGLILKSPRPAAAPNHQAEVASATDAASDASSTAAADSSEVPPSAGDTSAHPNSSSHKRVTPAANVTTTTSDDAITLQPRSTPANTTAAEPPSPPPQIQVSGAQGDNGTISSLLHDLAAGVTRLASPSKPPIRTAPVITSAEKISGPNPTYPATARELGIEGDVVMRVDINQEGKVKSVHVVRGNPALLSAAVSAVQRWGYRPYRVNGKPEPTEVTVTMRFSLHGR
jgi:TonB family protein